MGIYLSLGSNLGDRPGQLESALDALSGLDGTQDACKVLNVSPCYETAPWGVEAQPDFLNMAAEIETAMQPLELLCHIKAIELALGRVEEQRWGPRAIDIDIVLWHTLELSTVELTLPHAAFRRRRFVLAPLADIAAEAQDPVTGKTVRELLDMLTEEQEENVADQRPEVWLY